MVLSVILLNVILLNVAKALKLLGGYRNSSIFVAEIQGGVKTERVFPGLSVLRKNNKMEVLSPEK